MDEDARLKLTTVLLDKVTPYSLPGGSLLGGSSQEGSPWEVEVCHYSLSDCPMPREDTERYGRLQGIYRIWKEVHSPYICVNEWNILPRMEQRESDRLQNGEITMIVPMVFCGESIPQDYRQRYYGYDFNFLMSVLEKDHPRLHQYVRDKLLNSKQMLSFAGVFRKEEFDKICEWMFSVLAKCARHIPERFSVAQNRVLENLANYLFTFYVNYWKDKFPFAAAGLEILRVDPGMPEENLPESASREEVLALVEKLMEERRPEAVVAQLRRLSKDRKDLEDIQALFTRYDRERGYLEKTVLDSGKDWRSLLQEQTLTPPAIRNGSPKLLLLEWSSIGHANNVRGFESLGFECHSLRVSDNKLDFDEDQLEKVNRHLSANRYDLVFSQNFIGTGAVASYQHGIPYIAWCYDSPSFIGKKYYHTYPTTHIFLFDSDDTRHYREAGITQAYHMPLAVNLEYFDSIVCSDADRKKYEADVSFIGTLYDSTLPKAMNFLPDHQKSFISAMVDCQLDVYGHDFFEEILSSTFMEWVDQPEFNRLLNAEFDKEKAKENTSSVGRLRLVLNKQTTNKERLLLLSLLARHYEVKLYSNKSSQVLEGLTFCGVADYYREMPKIFQCSKINLNATLRSIRNGVPLRCLDVMGCHGLLLTNYQKDFDEHFEDERNLLFYTDAQEALDKARFYIEHDTLREKIAEAGYETIRKYYNYPVKIREILKTAGLEYLIAHK